VWWPIFLVASLFLQQGAAIASDSAVPERMTSKGGLKLVYIPSGEFLMGGGESAEELVAAFPEYRRKAEFFSDEYPRHRVRITRGFWIGVYEVTVEQFRRFVEETGYLTEAERDGTGGWGCSLEQGRCFGRSTEYSWRDPGYPQSDLHPVVNVTWNDAVAFCDWLSAREGARYRLPTEAEWEYVARAGSETRYAFGDDPSALPGDARVLSTKGRETFPHVQELDIDSASGEYFPVEVGRFEANAFGAHDMHGNVWEWCGDWYAPDYYAHSPSLDPSGPASGTRRVRRGGAWNSFPLWVRPSFRNWNTPVSRCVNLGFRVLREEG